MGPETADDILAVSEAFNFETNLLKVSKRHPVTGLYAVIYM